jgi:hypothetical protein
MRKIGRRAASAIVAILIGFPALAAGAEPAAGPDPEATAILRAMTDHLSSLPRFSVNGHGILEVVLTSGQKLQFDNDVTLTLERPNKLVATRRGEVTEQGLWFDGENLSLFSPDKGFYAAATGPKTIDAALDFARDEMDLVAPAGDLLYTDAFASLIADTTAGFVVSKRAWIGGQSCSHLAFRKPGVDFQIWIANGAQPWPLKYVLTTTDMPASPQYTVTLSDWNMAPRIDPGTFTFTPPAGAKRIDFVRPGSAPAPAQ